MDGINDDGFGLQAFDFVEDAFQTGFGQQKQSGGIDAQAFATQFDLAFAFFAGNIQHVAVDRAEFVGHLTEQR